jgi:hypothetical protein
MTIRRKCLTAIAVVAAVPVIFSLHGQNSNDDRPSVPPDPDFTEPKGLAVTSAILDR